MIKLSFKKDVLPHVIVVFAFIILSVIFHSPSVFSNKELSQNDVFQGIGAGKEAIDFREKTGKEALWTNSMFSGMPTYLINTYWSGDLMRYPQQLITLGIPAPARYTFLALVCFYIMLLVFDVRPILAAAGAIAYGFNSFNIIFIEAGHIWKVMALVYMPLVVSGIHLTIKGKKYWGFILTALALSLQIRSNHIQITYYLFLLMVIYSIFIAYKALKEKDLKNLLITYGFLSMAAILALGTNLGKIWSIYEYGKVSIRGASELSSASSSGGLDRGYAFDWSSGKMESLTLLVPNYCGGSSGVYAGAGTKLEDLMRSNNVPPTQIDQFKQVFLSYWGDQPFTSGPIYAGGLICFLFLLGALLVNGSIRNWLITATIFSILLSWGKNFESLNYFIFDYLPGYNKFRAVSTTIVIAMLCMPLLGFIGLEKLLKDGINKRTQKKILIALGSIVSLLLLIAAFASPPQVINDQFPAWLLDAINEDRLSIIRADVLRSFLFIIIPVALLFSYLYKKININIFLSGFILLLVLDLWFIDRRYLNDESYTRNASGNFFQETEADKVIKGDSDPNFRVLNLQNPWQEARTSYRHKSIGGYHGAKMRRYQDLIEAHLTREVDDLIGDLQSGVTSFASLSVLNMLNTKYFLAGNNRQSVIRNPNANGNVWFANKIENVSSPDQELQTLTMHDLKSTAIIDNSKFLVSNTSFGSEGQISLVEYKPNYLKYSSSNSQPGFAVFSEIYYPEGWRVFIDGVQSEYVRVNYVLRGMEVPAGNHIIEFRFEPSVYTIGNKVMFASSSILILLFLGAIVYSLKIKKETYIE